MDLDFLFIRHHRRLRRRMKAEVPSAKPGSSSSVVPRFENREACALGSRPVLVEH